ncbi:MAG: hypothetical protein ACYS7Y_29295 [Planctomycetota bacterium]
MPKQSECPRCGVTWLGEEIPFGLMATGNYASFDDAREAAADYGWTLENKLRFNVNVVGLEDGSYDGVAYWQCTRCKCTVDRFTNKVTYLRGGFDAERTEGEA